MTQPEGPTAAKGLHLAVDGVSRRFGATRALDNVSLDVAPGRVHALLGGNGSGKSTLIKILAGTEMADEGRITVGASVIAAASSDPQWSASQGLRFVHQDLGLFPDLSIAENLFAGRGYPRRRRAIDRAAVARNAYTALQRVHLDVSPATAVSDLGPAQRTMVAVARALHESPARSMGLSASVTQRRILVLDEPTATLPRAESTLLFDLLGRLRDAGDTVVLVSHRLGEITAIADSATVLRDGKVIATLDRRDVTHSVLHRLLSPARAAATKAPLLRRDAVSDTNPRLSVSGLRTSRLNVPKLDVIPCEIVGLLGLNGSGTQELLATIFGALPGRGRTVRVDGRTLRPRGVSDSVRHQIGYVPAERRARAAFLEHDIADNILMANLRQHRSPLGVSTKTLRRHAGLAIERYGVKAPSPTTLMSALSGGNQQKVVVGRWLERRTQLLLLAEPTQGVDVAARSDIWALIHEAVDAGMSVLMTSADLDEMATHCDRFLLMRQGAISGAVKADSADDLARAIYAP